VRAAVAEGLRVESVPGPSAVIAALQVSGLPTDAFTFVGFLPTKGAARRRRLEEWNERRETLVAFESPHRIDACLEDLEAIWGERPIALARELTKLHEQVLRGTAREVRAALRPDQRRGEMVLVLGGRTRGTGHGAPSAAPPAGGLRGLKERLRIGAHAVLDPVVRGLIAIGVRADHLTVAGLALSLLAGYAFFDAHSRLGAAFLLLAGVCDILDGQVARRTGGETRFGAFFDSTLDRLAEALVLMGIAAYYIRNLLVLVYEPERVLEQQGFELYPETWAAVAMTAVLALAGSFMVSYTRARAEGLGLECRVGWFERPERLVLLMLAGAIHAFWAMSGALLLLALLSFVTAGQRVVHVWKITRGAGRDQEV
jgi:phosphatidylglycerophosphate synthase